MKAIERVCLSSVVLAVTLIFGAGCSTQRAFVVPGYASPVLEIAPVVARAPERHFAPGNLGSRGRARTAPKAPVAGSRDLAQSTARDGSPVAGVQSARASVPAPVAPSPAPAERAPGQPPAAAPETTRAPVRSDVAEGPLSAAYVHATYGYNGVTLPAEARQNVASLFKTCKSRGRAFTEGAPTVGDLVFFHNTEDANADGRNNDWYTLVGFVEAFDGSSGTTTLLAYRGEAVSRVALNVGAPGLASLPDGSQANAALRLASQSDPPHTQHLAGQLFAGYCSMLGDRQEFLVADSWQPGSAP